MRLLVVEDAEDVADAIVAHFARAGHVCEHAQTISDGMHLIAAAPYDLVILDINLPDGTGFDFLKRLRAASNAVPVLVLTARIETDDKISALDFGADDYLVKPFDLRELEARARAITRRQFGAAEARLEIGNMACDLAARNVFVDAGEVELTRREFVLLEAFVSNLNRILQKEELYAKLFGIEGDAGLNAVEVYVGRLRKKLAHADLEIRTLRGLGYQAVARGRLT